MRPPICRARERRVAQTAGGEVLHVGAERDSIAERDNKG